MLDIEARVLIGWYSLASKSERVPTRCFYVKVAYLSYGEYIYIQLQLVFIFGFVLCDYILNIIILITSIYLILYTS